MNGMKKAEIHISNGIVTTGNFIMNGKPVPFRIHHLTGETLIEALPRAKSLGFSSIEELIFSDDFLDEVNDRRKKGLKFEFFEMIHPGKKPTKYFVI